VAISPQATVTSLHHGKPGGASLIRLPERAIHLRVMRADKQIKRFTRGQAIGEPFVIKP
jgi:hypothetical protein